MKLLQNMSRLILFEKGIGYHIVICILGYVIFIIFLLVYATRKHDAYFVLFFVLFSVRARLGGKHGRLNLSK